MYVINIVISVLFTLKNSFIFAGAFAAMFLIAAMASGMVSQINAQGSGSSGTTGASDATGTTDTSTGNNTSTGNSTSDLASAMTGTTGSEGGSTGGTMGGSG
jgi:hypothetical protein